MDSFEQKRSNIIWISKEIICEIFKVALVSFLLLYLADSISVGYVSDYFNINILLVITIISGIITVAFKEEPVKDAAMPMKKWDYIFILLLGIASTSIIYCRISEIGKLAYLISAVSGVIIILISILLISSSTDNKENNL